MHASAMASDEQNKEGLYKVHVTLNMEMLTAILFGFLLMGYGLAWARDQQLRKVLTGSLKKRCLRFQDTATQRHRST